MQVMYNVDPGICAVKNTCILYGKVGASSLVCFSRGGAEPSVERTAAEGKFRMNLTVTGRVPLVTRFSDS